MTAARRSALAPTAVLGLLGACALDGAGDGATGSDAGAASCEETADWDPAWIAFEGGVLERVNRERARGGDCGGEGTFGPSDALVGHGALRCSARLHALDMATRDYFDHVTPEGVDPFQRMEEAGYAWSTAGENIAAGQIDPDEVMASWLESPGHCRNILDPGFVHLGVGYAEGPARYGRYWTQNFGAPQ